MEPSFQWIPLHPSSFEMSLIHNIWKIHTHVSCCFFKVFSIILLHVYNISITLSRGFKKFALRYYYSSTTSSRRVGSRHMRVVCRLRQLRRIASRVLWRSGCILPWRHPFIRHIKTLSNKINRFRKPNLSPYYCSMLFITYIF